MIANQELLAACGALRAAIVAYPSANVELMNDSLYAIRGLEDAAVNAPQNRGWLRSRQVELRNALNAFAPNAKDIAIAGELHQLYRTIVALIHTLER